MKNNFESGTPFHTPEESNSFEQQPDEHYDGIFKKVQEESESYMKSAGRIGIRVSPEIYNAEVDRADTLEVALAVSNKERDELAQAYAVLIQGYDKLSQENQQLKEELEIKSIHNEPAVAEKIYALPTNPSLRRLNIQKMGHIANELN